MGSGYNERCGGCANYSMARIVPLTDRFAKRTVRGRELIKGVNYSRNTVVAIAVSCQLT